MVSWIGSWNRKRAVSKTKGIKGFPGGPVVKTVVKQLSSFTAGGTGSIPGWETKTLQACGRVKKEKQKNKEIQIKYDDGKLIKIIMYH